MNEADREIHYFRCKLATCKYQELQAPGISNSSDLSALNSYPKKTTRTPHACAKEKRTERKRCVLVSYHTCIRTSYQGIEYHYIAKYKHSSLDSMPMYLVQKLHYISDNSVLCSVVPGMFCSRLELQAKRSHLGQIMGQIR